MLNPEKHQICFTFADALEVSVQVAALQDAAMEEQCGEEPGLTSGEVIEARDDVDALLESLMESHKTRVGVDAVPEYICIDAVRRTFCVTKSPGSSCIIFPTTWKSLVVCADRGRCPSVSEGGESDSETGFVHEGKPDPPPPELAHVFEYARDMAEVFMHTLPLGPYDRIPRGHTKPFAMKERASTWVVEAHEAMRKCFLRSPEFLRFAGDSAPAKMLLDAANKNEGCMPGLSGNFPALVVEREFLFTKSTISKVQLMCTYGR